MIKFLVSLLGVVLLITESACVPTTPGSLHSDDHLLNLLQAIHHSQSFHQLPPAERVLLVELISAAEVDQVTHYIDRVGFSRIASFLDHVTKINVREAHLLEHYLVQELNEETTMNVGHKTKRVSLQAHVDRLMQTHLYTTLTADDQSLLLELYKATQSHNVTQFVHTTGYSKIIALVEHISSPTDTHTFLAYLVKHMEAEAAGHRPAVG